MGGNSSEPSGGAANLRPWQREDDNECVKGAIIRFPVVARRLVHGEAGISPAKTALLVPREVGT